ncbi:hypothetical protein BN1723_020119, partial [Verticillium longisporum]
HAPGRGPLPHPGPRQELRRLLRLRH